MPRKKKTNGATTSSGSGEQAAASLPLQGWALLILPETNEEDILSCRAHGQTMQAQLFCEAAADVANEELQTILNNIHHDHSTKVESTLRQRVYVLARFAEFVAKTKKWQAYIDREIVTDKLAGTTLLLVCRATS